MGARGPKPSGNAGTHVGAIVDAETFLDLEDVTYTRNRSRSFIAAEAMRLGLPAVKELYPPVRKSKAGAKKSPAKASASKKAGVKKAGVKKAGVKKAGVKKAAKKKVARAAVK
jgi:hypothetical protein